MGEDSSIKRRLRSRDIVEEGTGGRRFSPRLRKIPPAFRAQEDPEALIARRRQASESTELIQTPRREKLNGNAYCNEGRRFSPRLHMNTSLAQHLHNSPPADECGTTSGATADADVLAPAPPHRRLSPRLHNHGSRPAKKKPRQEGDLAATSGVCSVLGEHNHQTNRQAEAAAGTNTTTAHGEEDEGGVAEAESATEDKSPPDRKQQEKKGSLGTEDGVILRNHRTREKANNGARTREAEGQGAAAAEEADRKVEQDGPLAASTSAGRSAYARVKDTLRIFNTHYLHLVQEEEDRVRKAGGANGSDPKNKDVSETRTKKCAKRPDLKAITEMMKTSAILYPEKQFGNLPGIDVGYQFYSRAEMVAVGFHGHWLNGIDYIPISQNQKPDGHQHLTYPLAVSIVMSGQYEDDFDNREDIVYTGQGGNDLLGSRRQIGDQSLLRGNLALKNNMEQSVPVRVTRGHKEVSSYSGKVYTYDGLYKVVEYWAEKGISEHTVYKYRLKRLEGQPKLSTNLVQFSRGRGVCSLSALPGLVCCDISNGLEALPIPVTNIHDEPPVGITCFTYTKSIQVARGVKLPSKAPGCNCKGSCTNPKTCACAKLNGSDFSYVWCRGGGRLVEAKDIVFECGPNCGCGPECINRTSQRQLKYQLEVYRTPGKGWAVRSWEFIPSGSPVCEYIGVLRRSDELDHVSDNDYIFEIDCWQTIKGMEGRERRFKDIPIPASCLIHASGDDKSDGTPEFCIDAGSKGNVARFINHSCEPNLFVQCVLSSHHDIRLARVVLFAADNIPPLQELSYDYGYALDSVIGADGKIKVLPCLCGTSSCRKRLY